MILRNNTGLSHLSQLKKSENMITMLFNMDSKRVCLTFFFLILLPLVCEGQRFHHSYATPDSDLMRFRDYRKSIDILDGSKLLLHSEPLYEDIVYNQDSDFSAVSIPLNSIDTLNRRSYSNLDIKLYGRTALCYGESASRKNHQIMFFKEQ